MEARSELSHFDALLKEEPIAPSQLDPDQLAKVLSFKRQLSEGLYWSFQTSDDFETQVSLHLLQVVQRWQGRLSNLTSVQQSTTGPVESLENSVPHDESSLEPLRSEEEDELGFLDYRQLFDEANDRHVAVINRMSTAIGMMNAKIKERTAEAEALKAQPTVAAAREIFDQSARDLNDFLAAMLSEIPQMRLAHTDFLNI